MKTLRSDVSLISRVGCDQDICHGFFACSISTFSLGQTNEWPLYLITRFIFETAAGNPNMIKALAGNKVDLEDRRKVMAEVSGGFFHHLLFFPELCVEHLFYNFSLLSQLFSASFYSDLTEE